MPGPHVLDHHVGGARQRVRDVAPGRRAQIDRDAALVAVVALEEARLAIQERTPVPRQIAADRFDLDHVGAEVAEDGGAVRPRDVGAEVEDAHAHQRSGRRSLIRREIRLRTHR